MDILTQAHDEPDRALVAVQLLSQAGVRENLCRITDQNVANIGDGR